MVLCWRGTLLLAMLTAPHCTVRLQDACCFIPCCSPLERDPASCHAHGAPLHGEASGSLLFHTVLRAPLRAGARACCSHAFDVFLAYLACDRRASPWAACRCCAA